jgi:hypothetical protein
MALFNLLQKYAEDACFRCGEKIERIEDLSIEHKKPWEGISVELFWDLDNIAFSHLRCNLPHGVADVRNFFPSLILAAINQIGVDSNFGAIVVGRSITPSLKTDCQHPYNSLIINAHKKLAQWAQVNSTA